MTQTADAASVPGLRVQLVRQDGPGLPTHRQEVTVPVVPGETVHGLLRRLQQPGVAGDAATVVFEDGCAQGGPCRACVMAINGVPRVACATLVGALEAPVVLAPLAGFPVLADLWVDRSGLERSLRDAAVWVDLDALWEGPAALREPAADAQRRQREAACTGCGACQGVCPSVGPKVPYAGPAVLVALRGVMTTPVGRLQQDQRLAWASGSKGVAGCANARNCDAYCPRGLPTGEALADLNGMTTRWALARLWSGRR